MYLERGPLLVIIDPVDLPPALIQILVILHAPLQQQTPPQLPISPLQHLIKHMKAPLRLAPPNNPTLLEQIPVDVRARDRAVRRERDADELAEARRVVVALRLGIAECFEDGVRLEDLAFE